MKGTLKHLLVWVVTVGVLLLGWRFVTFKMGNAGNSLDKAISYRELLDAVNSNQIDSVTVSGDQVFGSYKDGKGDFHIELPVGSADSMNLLKDMQAHVLAITVATPQNNKKINFLIQIMPIAVLLVLGLYFWLKVRRGLRGVRGEAGQAPGTGA